MAMIGRRTPAGRRRRGLRRSRGQALIEFALLAPLLSLLVFVGADVARNYGTSEAVIGAARVGMLRAMTSGVIGVGPTITNASLELPPTVQVWGLAAPGQADDCSGGTKVCGDPGGCATGASPSAFWTATKPAPVACFALGTCTYDTPGPPVRCHSSPTWATRPLTGSSGIALDVRVVLVQSPLTPIVGQFFSGSIVVSEDVTSLPAY